MKQIIEVKTWEECLEQIKEIDTDTPNKPIPLWYRGQSNSDWELVTSLERRCPDREFTLLNYYKLILGMAPEVQSFTDLEWELPTFDREFVDWTYSYDNFHTLRGYDYLAYLGITTFRRHSLIGQALPS